MHLSRNRLFSKSLPLVFHVDDLTALDGHPTTVHTKIIGNFAIILHFEDREVSLLVYFERAHEFFPAKGIRGIEDGGGDSFGGSHAQLRTGERENHRHADSGTGAGIVIGGERNDRSGIDQFARGSILLPTEMEIAA